MATRDAGCEWARSPPLAPDTTSPIYPDRPIRPLPKRRLRDRLSAEAADAMIGAQPKQEKIFNLFSKSLPDNQSGLVGKFREHSDVESEEEEAHHHLYPPHFSHAGYDGGNDSRSNPPAPNSTTSSADGYESFENTNNKKKRKIPQSNGMGGHGHHGPLSSDLASMGIAGREGETSPADETGPAVGSYYGSGSAVMPSGSSGTGVSVSGAGRGRYGRSRGSLDRRPLAASTNGLNASAGRLRSSTYVGTKGNASGSAQPPAIISAAIANAAQQPPLTPEHGNENVSLLQQHLNKTPPQKADFTFQSEAIKGFTWPGPQQTDLPPPPTNPPVAAHLPPRSGVHTQATQTSPNLNGGVHMRPPAQGQHHIQPPVGQHRGGGSSNQPQGVPTEPPKRRKPRRPGRKYEINARRRKLQQEYQNYHNPPRREDIWICEFCEYENIFGEPPRALIRRYEERDEAEQKRLAEKRRLLEKAKAKGRKGKKGTKSSKNNTNNHQAAQQNQRYDPPGDYLGEDEYYEDDYVDEDQMDLPATPQPEVSVASSYPPGAYASHLPQPPSSKHIAQAAAHAHPHTAKGQAPGLA